MMIAFFRYNDAMEMIAGAYKKWNVVIPAKSAAEERAGDVCYRICSYLKACGYLTSPSAKEGYYFEYTLDDCISDCSYSKQEVYASDPQCVQSATRYTDCLLALNCKEFDRLVDDWTNQDLNPCYFAYLDMDQNCKNESWYQSMKQE